MTTRILNFPNKAWEAAPLVGAFPNDQARPPRFPDFETPPQVAIPLSDGSTKTVAARLALKTANATAEVWCIQDLMDPTKSASSSEEKARVLPYVPANGAPPSLVIAFGTAATAEPKQTVGSVETTHELIRLVVPSPQFLFVSPIANRLGYFNTELAPRSYAQNFAVSHNAGVALAWMMPILMA